MIFFTGNIMRRSKVIIKNQIMIDRVMTMMIPIRIEEVKGNMEEKIRDREIVIILIKDKKRIG